MLNGLVMKKFLFLSILVSRFFSLQIISCMDTNNSAQTSIVNLPTDVLNKIIAYTPTSNDANQRIEEIKSVFNTSKGFCKNLLGNGINAIKSNVVAKKYNLAFENMSPNEKKCALSNAYNQKDYKLFCALLCHDPELVIPENGDITYSYLIKAVTAKNLPPLTVFEAIINAMVVLNQRHADIILDINAKTNLTTNIINTRVEPISFVTTDDNSLKLNAIDILICRILHTGRSIDNTELDVRYLTLEYLKNKGAKVNFDTQINFLGFSESIYNYIFYQTLNSNISLRPFILEKFRDQIDINICVDSKTENTILMECVNNPKELKIILTYSALLINKKNQQGNTALDIAQNPSNPFTVIEESINLLIQHGALTSKELLQQSSGSSSTHGNAVNAQQRMITQDNNQPDHDAEGTTHIPSSTNQINQTQHNTQQPSTENGQQQNASSDPLPPNTDSNIKSRWYTSPSVLWLAATASCVAALYGIYTYLYPSADEDDEDDEQDDTGHVEASPAPITHVEGR